MKTKFAIGNLEINGVKIENISIEQEYSVGEAVDMMKCGKDFVREIIRDLPEVMENVERIMAKAEEIDDKINEEKDNHIENNMDNFIKHFMNDLGIPGEIVRISPEELFGRIHRPRG